MFEVDFHILNQKATPAIYADTLANRPAASFAGRLFVDTSSPYGIYRDTGSAWVQIAGNGGGGSSTGVNGLNGTTNIGLGGTLTSNTTIAGNGKSFSLQNTSSFISGSSNTNFQSYFESNPSILKLFTENILNSVSSELNVSSLGINSIFNGSAYFGLNLDDTTGKFALGDYGNDRKYNSFVVNDDASTFYFTTSFNQVNNNQDLFYASNASSGTRFVKIGDFNNYAHGFSFIVDDANYAIYTTTNNDTNGLYIGNGFSNFGSLTSTYLYLGINTSANEIATYNTALTSDGLSLDFGSNNFRLGKFNSGTTWLEINDTSQIMTLNTENITFTGTALQSNTSSGNSGEHLVITLNGTQYKIALQNP